MSVTPATRAEEHTTMTEPLTPNPHDEQTPDETFTWTGDQAGDARRGPLRRTPTPARPAPPRARLLDRRARPAPARPRSSSQLREAVDDLAERASPTVREFSARAAELAATAADKAAPMRKRAGEATADASGKLAEKSRTWASDIRASMAAGRRRASAAGTVDLRGTPTTPTADAPTQGRGQSDRPTLG